MTVYIKTNSSIYSADKAIYLNGQKVTPTKAENLGSLAYITIEDINLIRGNPNGKINGVINIIEYK